MSTPVRYLWWSRLSPVWFALFSAAIGGGLAAWGITGSTGAALLGAAGIFLMLAPAGGLLGALLIFGFANLTLGEARERAGALWRSADPRQTVAPILFCLQLPLLVIPVWWVSGFSAMAFKRGDLAAYVVAASAVIGLLLMGVMRWVLAPVGQQLAARIIASGRTWLPLASVGSSVVWASVLLVGLAGSLGLSLRLDLAAADWETPLVIAGGHVLLLAIVLAYVGGQARPRVSWALRQIGLTGVTALGVPLILLGVVAAPGGPATNAAVDHLPGLAQGVALGRVVFDFDGDGFSHWFNGGDCAPFEAAVYPGARDLPDNHVDEDCSGSDASLQRFKGPAARYVDPSGLCPAGDCNVLLLTIDSLRADHLTPYGARQEFMPQLEALARDSVVFENAYSPGPGTILAIPSMLAGVFDSQLKMDKRTKGPLPVHRDVRLIQESLQQKGVTRLAVLEHVYLDPLNQGWTRWFNPWSRKFYLESTAQRQADKVIEWITQYRDKPIFLFAHFNEPHHNYLLHPGFDQWGDSKLGRYRSELAFTDFHLGRILRTAREQLAERPTLIIVSADHGEGLGQHGIRFHNGGFYRELLQVPLIVWHSALQQRTLEAPVSLLDIAPTLRNLYGLPPRADHVGTSLLGQLIFGRELTDRTVYHQALYDQGGRYFNLVGLTKQHLRLFHDMRRQTWELYDIKSDPKELNNLAAESNPQFKQLKAELIDWLQAINLTANFVHRPWEIAPPGAR